MAEQILWTYQDAVERLIDRGSIDRSGLSLRHARRAVLDAYLELSNAHRWECGQLTRILQTSASQSSSTITYDHTGGASERLVTIAAGTFPSWAALGVIVIDDVPYPVATRESSTTLTLRPESNPGADVAAGTSYKIYRYAYVLPVNFRRVIRLYDLERKWEVPFMSQDHLRAVHTHLFSTPSVPEFASVGNPHEYFGALSLMFTPPPSAARSYELHYEAGFRPLAFTAGEKYSTGTAAVSAGSTTCTITTGSLPESCINCVIRFSADGTTEPTSAAGGLAGDNPYFAQRIIIARASGTSVTLDSVVHDSTALSGVKFTVSDPIDIEPQAMQRAFWDLCEANYAKHCGKDDWRDLMGDAYRAVRLAIEADQREPANNRAMLYDPYLRTTVDAEIE